MKLALFAIVGAAALMLNTGCGIGDQMFAYHKPWGGCNGGCDCGNGGGCGNGGACGNCGGDCGDPNGGYTRNGKSNGGYANDARPSHDTLPRGVGGEYVGPQGPPTGAVAYPYYTNHGPRDFLLNNPPSLGP